MPEAPETPDRLALRLRREAAARRILDDNPLINNVDLARQIAIATSTRTSESTARNVRDAVRFVPITPAAAAAVDNASDVDEGEDAQRRN
jgi:hypothetical protein